MDEQFVASIHTALLIAVVGVLAWLTGLPTLFPSLGPSAFVLATLPDTEASDPRRVILGHAVGVVAGFVGYHLFATGVVVTSQIAPLSVAGLRIAVSSVVAIALTVAGMLSLDAGHPPACATTLIVALGLLARPVHGVLIVSAVAALIVVDRAIVRAENRLRRLGRPDAARS